MSALEGEGVDRVLDTLRLAMRLLDITNRQVESKLQYSHGYLSRIFAGNIELRVSHILDITGVIGMDPAEFFDLAWPAKPNPPTPPAARLQSLLRRFQPSPSSETVTKAEVAGLIHEILEGFGIAASPAQES